MHGAEDGGGRGEQGADRLLPDKKPEQKTKAAAAAAAAAAEGIFFFFFAPAAAWTFFFFSRFPLAPLTRNPSQRQRERERRVLAHNRRPDISPALLLLSFPPPSILQEPSWQLPGDRQRSRPWPLSYAQIHAYSLHLASSSELPAPRSPVSHRRRTGIEDKIALRTRKRW